MAIRAVVGSWLALAAMSFSAIPTGHEAVTIPFDFSRSSIGLNVTVRDKPLYVILDTGVNPSVIDLSRAEQIGLQIDGHDGGDPSGFGEGKGATVFPSSIDHLAIGGHLFAPFDALASDMTAISAHYGRKLDGVLGYSFLMDKIVLIDYPQQTVGILAAPADATPMAQSCRVHWTTPLRTIDSFPVIPHFRFGSATGPLTLDTGSNGGISLYQSALTLKGVRGALSQESSVTFGGARGQGTAKTYALNATVGFGPFTLPAGAVVTLRKEKGSKTTRVANGGNALFAALKLKMLLDYRDRFITFYGDCR